MNKKYCVSGDERDPRIRLLNLGKFEIFKFRYKKCKVHQFPRHKIKVTVF